MGQEEAKVKERINLLDVIINNDQLEDAIHLPLLYSLI